jgi:hypothetical protein
MVMWIECKDCGCNIDYCCCDEACPVCGEAPTHCDGLAAFAAEFGIAPLPPMVSKGEAAAVRRAIPLGEGKTAMFQRSRLLDCLILILGLAVVLDTSIQLRGHPDDDIVWQPITDAPDCCDVEPIDDLHPVFKA